MQYPERTFRECYTGIDLQEVTKWKSETQDGGSVKSVTWISSSAHDNNEITMAVFMLSGSDNTEGLVGILSHFWVSWKSKMAAAGRK